MQRAIKGIVELLEGQPNDLADIVLDLDGVPAFNRDVYDIARRIPPGKTLTYGDIAKQLGGVEKSRDVGQASDATPVRSWCPATACSPPAASPADFPPMAAFHQAENAGDRRRPRQSHAEPIRLNFRPDAMDREVTGGECETHGVPQAGGSETLTDGRASIFSWKASSFG